MKKKKGKVDIPGTHFALSTQVPLPAFKCGTIIFYCVKLSSFVILFFFVVCQLCVVLFCLVMGNPVIKHYGPAFGSGKKETCGRQDRFETYFEDRVRTNNEMVPVTDIFR